ncbi:hypothetical protein [Secundilactobacillus paracollinoides]|uniref:hypothetical protein n=1 Tax=Secundilactobacillus paracollinoides TaxID=240427 RepID=UPI0012EA8947|nr:hypothetical protein [Secundilactobacillus paracollinoides]
MMTKQHHRSLVKTLTVLGAFLLVGGRFDGVRQQCRQQNFRAKPRPVIVSYAQK